MSESVCIYHGNCVDGFTAAWVVRKHFMKLQQDCKFHPGFYGESPPDVTDKHVILTDFSYKRPVLEQLAKKAASVLVLDHHKTAEADLKDLEGVDSIFDMERAGCRITWDYFFPGETPPQLLLHIEDRDLWRFALRATREIQAAVFSFEYKFDIWDWLMKQDPAQLAKDGEAIERKHFKDIRELIGASLRHMTIANTHVPVLNVPYMLASDAGNILAEGQPFAASYFDTEDARVFSLRSKEGGMDVSEVAKGYGGGGHKHASGFRVSRAHELAR
jgi:oligoribonuclease NrnB/cAMP/cGMP phosphodiesterase (DHH superfamily)